MNVFTFSGNLGRDAELKQGNSSSYVRFAVAVKSGYGDKAKTDWIDCVLFGKRAESLAQHLNKGTQVIVSGEASLNVFNKQDGTQGASIAVNVREVTLVGGNNQNAQPKQQAQQAKQQTQQSSVNDQDIPF